MAITIFIAFLALAAFSAELPQKAYLEVPFLCQAPYGKWVQPWQDGCEEAAIVMAINYMKGDRVTRRSGDQEILKLVAFQKKKYGGHYDLTMAQLATFIRDYYTYNNIEVRYDITVADIKTELAKGNVVIAPMAGRLLGNPYYTPPGPAYHYMLFKGYDDRTSEFITNDMGTKRGRNYRYKYDIAFNAIHDWTGNRSTITSGRKAILVVKYIN
jgi:hypothetical protein